MMAAPLYILRHGETTWNRLGRLQGGLDSPLTPQGIAQAQAQQRILATENLDGYRAVSSPQGRALATARIALQGVIPQISTDPDLAEIGLGGWAGASRDQLMAENGAVSGFDLYELAPGGEGFAALHDRCARFLDRLREPAVLVTHGITSRMLRLILTGGNLADLPEIGGGQGVVYRVAEGRQECLSGA